MKNTALAILLLAILGVVLTGTIPVTPKQMLWEKAVVGYHNGQFRKAHQALCELGEKCGKELTPQQKERVSRLEKRIQEELERAPVVPTIRMRPFKGPVPIIPGREEKGMIIIPM